MNSHRYQYLYLPAMRFVRQLSPAKRALLIVAKITLIVVLLSFQIATISGSV